MVWGKVPGSTVVEVERLIVEEVVELCDVVVDLALVVVVRLADVVVDGKVGGAVSPQLDKTNADMGRSSFNFLLSQALRFIFNLMDQMGSRLLNTKR